MHSIPKTFIFYLTKTPRLATKRVAAFPPKGLYLGEPLPYGVDSSSSFAFRHSGSPLPVGSKSVLPSPSLSRPSLYCGTRVAEGGGEGVGERGAMVAEASLPSPSSTVGVGVAG